MLESEGNEGTGRCAEHTRVVIADDHELVREGIISIIRSQRPKWEIVGEASNGNQAEELSKELRPSVLLLDLDLPGQDGLAVLQHLSRSCPDVRIIILSMHSGELVTRKLRTAGARGFVNKSDAPQLIVRAIEEVMEPEGTFFSDRAVRGNQEGPRNAQPSRYVLSKRELEVLRELALGKLNKEIAGDLNLSVRTVETHRANIFRKLQVDSLADLVSIAVRDKLV